MTHPFDVLIEVMKSPPSKADGAAFHRAMEWISSLNYPSPLFYILFDCKVLLDCWGGIPQGVRDHKPELDTNTKWNYLRRKLKLMRTGAQTEHSPYFSYTHTQIEYKGQKHQVEVLYNGGMLFRVFKSLDADRYFVYGMTGGVLFTIIELEIDTQEAIELLNRPNWHHLEKLLIKHRVIKGYEPLK